MYLTANALLLELIGLLLTMAFRLLAGKISREFREYQ